MKKVTVLLFSVLLVLLAGCSILGMRAQENIQSSQPQAATGKVTINLTLTRISGRSSNQYAVWIEDEAGRYIRTLFVTDYMARRQGWKVRQQSLSTWVKVADVKNMSQEDIDSVSGATPQTGKLSVVWNMKDVTGKAVVAGNYIYRIEGSLLSENTVLWTGKIQVGGAKETSQATVSYFPDGADKLGRTLISDVLAVYEPAP